MKLDDLTEDTVSVDPSKILTNIVKKLGEIFAKRGFELRVVGGAVRDVVLGKEPKDIDLATDATPEEMKKLAYHNNIPLVNNNGESHGTITFHINGENYEVTTLRVDTNQDGRHSDVEWTRSFEKDAERRDLTINAMSMDMTGRVYDYFGGIEDLKAGRVEFVGDAETRIQEDFLRILRYFRFYGRQSNPTVDQNTLQAIKDNAAGLKQISGERIWMEMAKILTGNHVGDILDMLEWTGVNTFIGLPVNNVSAVDVLSKRSDNPVTIMTLMLDQKSFDWVVAHWKLSNPERDLGNFLIQNRGFKVDETSARNGILMKKMKAEHLAELAVQQGGNAIAIRRMSVPEFPVSGKDLISLGYNPGQQLGEMLISLKARWVASLDNVPLTKEQLLQNL